MKSFSSRSKIQQFTATKLSPKPYIKMMKLIIFAALLAVAYAGGYGGYAVDYGFTAGGYGGHGYGGHGHGGHAKVTAHQNPHHYRFGVQEGGHGAGRHHWQTADTSYGGYGHGGGYGGGHGYGR